MNTILHDFYINVSKEKVFEAISSPNGLNNWWTLQCTGQAKLDEEYNLYFGDEYNWFAKVSKFKMNEEIEFKMTKATEDWQPTRFVFILTEEKPNVTYVQFYHSNWQEANKNYRISSYCWGSLLSQLKQYLEKGIITPFEARN